jgi:hypothetical protein
MISSEFFGRSIIESDSPYRGHSVASCVALPMLSRRININGIKFNTVAVGFCSFSAMSVEPPELTAGLVQNRYERIDILLVFPSNFGNDLSWMAYLSVVSSTRY